MVYSDKKTGRSAQAEITDEMKPLLLNRRIGDVVDGAVIGLSGYKLQITGGSDKSGFPMDASLQGSGKRSMLSQAKRSGRDKGVRTRRTVAGSMVSENTEQVNAVIVEYGAKSIDEVLPKKEKPAGEAQEAKQ
ncbi:MAG: 30S ribosomal protein S6e [Candidatus Marsarchaeota archaeon]|jgi:small subunit ribosomal protein S6e|nr:30S ribosomal protein S6e [Candidatus Marsarchaeota archaeon]